MASNSEYTNIHQEKKNQAIEGGKPISCQYNTDPRIKHHVKLQEGQTKIKVGVLGGSFDPPTIAHLQIAAEVLNLRSMDIIWVIPCGQRKDKNLKVLPIHRYIKQVLCCLGSKCANQRFNNFSLKIFQYLQDEYPIDYLFIILEQVHDIEVINEKSIPTYQLLQKLTSLYPSLQFSFILGTDLIKTVQQWQNGQKLLEKYNFIIYQRHGYEIDFSKKEELQFQLPKNHHILDPQSAIISKLSSTQVRNRIQKIKQLRKQKEIKSGNIININCQPGQYAGKIVNESVIEQAQFFQNKAVNYFNVSGLITKQVLQYIISNDLF